MTVSLNKKVPAFSSPVTGGKNWKLSDAAGKKLVLYFYPKDNTTGCTLEGQAFRDLHAAFKKAGTVVLGVSPDGVASHEKFKGKMEFPFDLLSDEDKKVCELFAVWKEKSMYGRKYMGVARITYLIDGSGKVARRWDKVSVSTHADDVLGPNLLHCCAGGNRTCESHLR